MKNNKSLMIILAVFFLLIQTSLQKIYKYDVFNKKPGFFTFEWEIINNERIKITLDVEASGWVGFGVSKNGFMRNSDVVIGYLDANKNPVVEDRFSNSYLQPQTDVSNSGNNDISDVSGSYTNNRLRITFSKPLTARTKEDNGNDYSIIKGYLTPVIFAYKDGESVLSHHTDMSSHRLILWPENDNQEVNLIDYSYRTDETVLAMRVRMDKFKVPTEQKTNYYCKMFNLNEEINKATNLDKETTYHLIAYEPYLQQQEKNVHHMIIYSCDPKTVKYNSEIFECTKMPDSCGSLVTIQGLGTGSVIYPKEAGQILGTGLTKIVTLQMHYEHMQMPAKNEVIYDSSGFDLYFTTKLRKYDIGISTFGPILDYLKIPPKTEKFMIEDYCSSKCTTSSIDGDGIKVVAFVLHGHQLLKDIRHHVYDSKGNLKQSFLYDDYDFNKQQIVVLQNPLDVVKGDSFKLQCTYNTKNVESVTIGGEASNQEMCYSFVFYYPKENGLNYCTNFFGSESSPEFEICQGDDTSNKTLSNVTLDRKTMKFKTPFEVTDSDISISNDNSSSILNYYQISLFLIIFWLN